MATFYTQKLVVSGRLIEHYEYEVPVMCGADMRKRKDRFIDYVPEPDEKEPRLDNARRAATNARRLCAANAPSGDTYTPKMLTVTFAENLTDLALANSLFNDFIVRFNRYLAKSGDPKLAYLAVGEQQKRGAWHYHIALFNCGWMPNKVIETIWGHGFVKIEKITDFAGLERYVSKYFSKKFADEKLKGSKSYHGSHGLLQPIFYTADEHRMQDGIIDTVTGEAEQQCQFSYQTDWHGQAIYTKFYAESREMYNFLLHDRLA